MDGDGRCLIEPFMYLPTYPPTHSRTPFQTPPPPPPRMSRSCTRTHSRISNLTTHHQLDDVARTSFLRKQKKRFEISPQHAPGEAYHATIARLKALYKGKVRALEEKVGGG